MDGLFCNPETIWIRAGDGDVDLQSRLFGWKQYGLQYWSQTLNLSGVMLKQHVVPCCHRFVETLPCQLHSDLFECAEIGSPQILGFRNHSQYEHPLCKTV